MKRILAGAVLALLPFSSASADTVFVGDVFIDFVSGNAQCTSTFAVNDSARVLYRPRGAAMDNGADSHLAYISTRASLVLRVANNDFRPNINYVGSGVSSRAALISNSGGITVWSQQPAVANVTAATPAINIKGRFANFFGITGCFVEIRGSVAPR